MSTLQAASKLCNAGLTALTQLFLHQGCVVCDRPAVSTFCTDCQRQLHASYYPCKTWQLHISNNIPVGTLGEYSGTLKQAIRALKYQNRPEVAKTLGHALAQRWLMSPMARQPDLYGVPIPLHENRLAQRGYNQAALIAQSFCQASGLPMLAHGLSRQQDTLPQHQLGLSARQENLKQAFCVGKALQKRQQRSRRTPRILLIDDIYTTGATTHSAADVLTASGLPVVGMLALARAVND